MNNNNNNINDDYKKKTTNKTISYELFKENLKNIFEISQKLFDNWHLKEIIDNPNDDDDDDDDNNKILYLEKFEQCYLESNLYTFMYQIFYSFSYNVPVFYLNVFESNGKLLKLEKIFDLLKLSIPTAVSNTSAENDDEYLDMFTITEHPYLHKPTYYIHPCKTSKWMYETSLIENSSSSSSSSTSPMNINYTLKWLSFVFSQLNLKLDIQYSKYVLC
jgi:hypothetical protein